MRSEFEKYFKENHADSFYSVDAALEMRGDDYIDFHAADLWALWQHQQSKVDELTKQRDSFIKAYQIEMDESVELQKRVDLLEGKIKEALNTVYAMKGKADCDHLTDKEQSFVYGFGYELHEILKEEQALKGGEA